MSSSVGILVFSDDGLTIPLTSIDWGEVTIGQAVTTRLYVRNIGTVNTTLNITAESFVPSGLYSNVITSSDYDGSVIPPSMSRAIILSLTVLEATPGTDFSFNVGVTPTGAQDMGVLHVTTSPAAGEIYVDGFLVGVGEYTGPQTVGQHLVSFSIAEGYITPDDIIAEISVGLTTTISAVYRLRQMMNMQFTVLGTMVFGSVILIAQDKK